MTICFDANDARRYLMSIMPGHKALGLLAQLEFERWIGEQNEIVRNKYFRGCWITALKGADFYALRTCFFVSPEVVLEPEIEETLSGHAGNRQFHAMCSSLNSAGFDVVYCFPVVKEKDFRTTDVKWRIYRYLKESLVEEDPDRYFSVWYGRGRVSRPREWVARTVEKFKRLDEKALTSLVLPQLFYNGLFKGRYRANTMDPYDTDGFIISYDGKVFPVELKEKFPFRHQSMGSTIGVDVGRILMMLRICVPLDANGFYIVREVEETEERRLVGWRLIRLDELLVKCSWNVQAGGPGMASSAAGAGSPTSTILVPHKAFSEMTPEIFSDGCLRRYATLTEGTRRLAQDFIAQSLNRFGLVGASD